MVSSFSLISLIIIANHCLIPILNASPSEEDKMLIMFMKGHQETQLSEYSIQKYEEFFGLVYFMRMNWKCDKIANEFEEYERTECQKYRKYLDILYEYLFREYVGIPTVKPKFVFQREIEIEGPIIYAVYCLVKISQFYFVKSEGYYYKYKLNKLFPYRNFEPKLLGEERLNYVFELKNEAKLPINEMILQLAIDTANECQTNESLDGIIKQKFEENLKEMFKKAEETAKQNGVWLVNNINDAKYDIIIYSKFDDSHNWIMDYQFSEFVKGLATNFGRKKFDKYKTQQFEALLGTLYLMRKNWQCASAKIEKKIEENKWKECQMNRKYLHILYEYFFRLYVEGKSTELAKKFQAIKPKFKIDLISVVIILNDYSKFLWGNGKNINLYIKFSKLVLVNEVELNYKIKEEKNWISKFTKNVLEKINGPKNVEKKGKKILNSSNKIEDNLRQEFEQKMENMCENTKENVKEEKAKLKKARATNDFEPYLMDYENKFGTFLLSPFS